MRAAPLILAGLGLVVGLGAIWVLSPSTGDDEPVSRSRRERAAARAEAGAEAQVAEPVEEVPTAPVERIQPTPLPGSPAGSPNLDLFKSRATENPEGDAVYTPMVVAPDLGTNGEPEKRKNGKLPADVVGIEQLVKDRDADLRTCVDRHAPPKRGETRVITTFTIAPTEDGSRVTALKGTYDDEGVYAGLMGCFRAALDAERLQPVEAEREITWPLRW